MKDEVLFLGLVVNESDELLLRLKLGTLLNAQWAQSVKSASLKI